MQFFLLRAIHTSDEISCHLWLAVPVLENPTLRRVHHKQGFVVRRVYNMIKPLVCPFVRLPSPSELSEPEMHS